MIYTFILSPSSIFLLYYASLTSFYASEIPILFMLCLNPYLQSSSLLSILVFIILSLLLYLPTLISFNIPTSLCQLPLLLFILNSYSVYAFLNPSLSCLSLLFVLVHITLSPFFYTFLLSSSLIFLLHYVNFHSFQSFLSILLLFIYSFINISLPYLLYLLTLNSLIYLLYYNFHSLYTS